MLTKEELPACPVATTVQLIGSKWKLLILRNLMARPWRFNELRRDLEGISQKVLTDSLRAMEEDGIITRTVYPEVPPRVEYALSPLGESMRPILDAMEEWGTNYKKVSSTLQPPSPHSWGNWGFLFMCFFLHNRLMNILQTIFKDHYEEIIYTLYPRKTEVENIDKMINCGDPSFGGAMYGCPSCGKLKFVPFRCHSRFCPTCGK